MRAGRLGKFHLIVPILTLNIFILIHRQPIIAPLAFTSATTIRVSVDSAGNEANNSSSESSISSDGRYVAFSSSATNLISSDTNGYTDVFVHDVVTGETNIVSVSSTGVQGNDQSDDPEISGNGRYVAFQSGASNLVENDTNGGELFIHDLHTGQTTRVAIPNIHLQANDSSSHASVSFDGRYVAFDTLASNLVSGDTNGARDIFIRDRDIGVTIRVSIASDGTQANGGSAQPSISADGRYIAFHSLSNNLVSEDNNSSDDVFVHDLLTQETTRVSINSEGTEGNGASYWASISDNGRYVAFVSHANNLVQSDINNKQDVFVHDRLTGQTAIASISSAGEQANNDCSYPVISGNGRYVAFNSESNNLVVGGNILRDVYVHDLQTGVTTQASLAWDGTPGNKRVDNRFPAISYTGRFVVFATDASNLVGGDYSGLMDVFVRDRGSIFDYYFIYLPII
jgi:hypothetical protein